MKKAKHCEVLSVIKLFFTLYIYKTMTFVKFQNSNNANSTMIADISASATALLIKDWDQSLFPTTFPFLLTLEHLDSDWNVTLREIVKATASNQNSYTIVRWAWTCVQDDTASNRSQDNTAHAFYAGDRVSLYRTAEQVKDIQDKLETSVNDTAIASEYDSTATYDVDDVVMYKWDRYVCNTAVSVAEAFDSTKWTKVSVQYDLDTMQTEIDDLASQSGASDHLEDEWLVGSYYELTDTMFRQLTTTYDNASVDANVGDVNANTELHIQRQGSWTASNQLKLKVKMWWSPTTSLIVEVRKWISVINSNKKTSYWYGDSNNVIATATLPYTTFSSSYQEITVALDNSFGWTEWELLDIVIYQANHIVNASNYYVIACDSTQQSDAFQYLKIANDLETVKQSGDIPYCVSDWFANILLTRVTTAGAYALPRNLKTLWEKAKLTTFGRHTDGVWLDHKSEDTIEYVHGGYKTFTVKRSETSTPTSAFVEYADDAEWLTQWSSDFDTFFGFSWVRLTASWLESWTVDLTSMSSQSGLTSWDNVMVKFPIRGIKMTKSWSTVTLSITNNPNAEDEWFQYFAHSRWTLSNPVKKSAFYLWVYEWSLSSSVLKSLSGATVEASHTMQEFINYARANDSNDWTAWYDIVWFYQRMYINALYMMKYCSLNTQWVIGQWIVSWSKQASWWSNSIAWVTGGDTSWTTSAMKLFWLENWWWNVSEWLGWLCTDWSKNLWTALSGFVGDVKNTSPYENTWTAITTTSWNCLSSIAGNNKALFAPIWTVNNSNYNTYYSDFAYVNASCLAFAGGSYGDGASAGAFYLIVNYSASNSSASIGSRLMFL